MNPPPTQLILRIGQLDQPASDPVLTGSHALYRLVDGCMTICAGHLRELATYQQGLEARVILAVDQIEAIVMELGLSRDDLMKRHGPQDPVLGEERCQMCATTPVDGNLCHNDSCKRMLHPQWPAVYCSNSCAFSEA